MVKISQLLLSVTLIGAVLVAAMPQPQPLPNPAFGDSARAAGGKALASVKGGISAAANSAKKFGNKMLGRTSGPATGSA
ncbi:hypothetical protein H4R33_005394 [Dimargaris cristalligena]|nr:hypothetical protein H4R33_005394 [Dimargaris cristalligena]